MQPVLFCSRLCFSPLAALRLLQLSLLPPRSMKHSAISTPWKPKMLSRSTIVTGVSQGGTTALAAAFKWQDKIAYVGSFAPSTGVIPTPFYKSSFWNTPILDDFTIDSPETMPRYIYLCVGTEDPWCINSTLYYGEVMDEKGIPNRTELVEGYDHGNDMWELGHYNFLQKIFLD